MAKFCGSDHAGTGALTHTPRWVLCAIVCGIIAVLAIPVYRTISINSFSAQHGTAVRGEKSQAAAKGEALVGEGSGGVRENSADAGDGGTQIGDGDAGLSGAGSSAGNKAEAAAADSGAENVSAQPVVLIGFGGLPWEAISKENTPHLYRFVQTSAAANLVDKTLGVTTCPNSAWLTLSTGKRTQESLNTAKLPCQLPPEIIDGEAENAQSARTAIGADMSSEGTSGNISNTAGSGMNSSHAGSIRARIAPETWNSWLKANSDNGYAPVFGSFAEEIARNLIPLRALGTGAAIAATRSDGSVAGTYYPLQYAHGIATNAGAVLAQALSGSSAQPSAAMPASTQPSTALPSTAAANTALTGITLIDLGSARISGWELGSERGVQKGRISAAFGVPDVSQQAPAEQMSAIDAQFGAVLEQLPDKALIIAASLNEADSATAQLQFFAMHQPLAEQPTPPTLAYTHSTRHSGLVQTTDITAALLLAAGIDTIDTEKFVGSPIRMGEPGTIYPLSDTEPSNEAAAQAHISELADVNRRALLTRAALGSFLIAFGVVSLLYCAFCGIYFGLARRPLRRPCLLAGIGLSICAVPASALLATFTHWWQVPQSSILAAPVWAFFAVLIAIAGLIGCGSVMADKALCQAKLRLRGATTSPTAPQPSAVTSSSPSLNGSSHTPTIPCAALRPAVAVAIFTVTVFVIDAATGSNLHYISVLGAQQPQDGSRFYGFGNTAHITVALACIFLAGAAADYYMRSGVRRGRLWALASVIGIGMIDLVANASGSIGADFGGTIGIIVSFGLLALYILKARVKIWQLILIAVLALAAAIGVAVLDWLRPEDERTHVGDFVQSVLNGELGQVLVRKLELFAAAGSPLVWALTLVPIILLLVGAHLARAHWRALAASQQAFTINETAIRPTTTNQDPTHAAPTSSIHAPHTRPPLADQISKAHKSKAAHKLPTTALLNHTGNFISIGASAGVALSAISLGINDSGPLLPFLGAAFAIPLWLASALPCMKRFP